MSIVFLLVSPSVVKFVFASAASFVTIRLAIQSEMSLDVFLTLLHENPKSQTPFIFIVIYGVIALLIKMSNAWKKHQINLSDVVIYKIKAKEAEERLEREEIRTEREREDLLS
ncbi:hypothetical protein [Flavicella sp.]|uniref:hypothetical protein n=1 Tax=Flavicella sp. TaxID=2957742 RepID=UPI00301725C5